MTRLVEITVSHAVLARACAGDEQAQGAIYAAVAPAWKRLCLSLDLADFRLGAAGTTLVTQDYRGESIDLERALATLAPTARAVVWMYEVEGYTHQEIARAFGRSVSFSKSQLARAHLRLRAWFEPQGNRPSCTLI